MASLEPIFSTMPLASRLSSSIRMSWNLMDELPLFKNEDFHEFTILLSRTRGTARSERGGGKTSGARTDDGVMESDINYYKAIKSEGIL